MSSCHSNSSTITSAAFNSVLISPAANTNGNSFFVSLGYTSIDDTLGIVSTNNDSADGNGEKRIRQLASSSFGGGWRRMGELYNYLDLDVVIIPVVNTTVGINSPFELKDASLAPVFPSPSKDKVTLSYNLKKESKISYKLFDITGKVFYQQQPKTTAKGKHAQTIDISKFASGKYYLTFTCNGSPVTQSITVIK